MARKDSKLIYGVVNGIEHVFYVAEWDNRLHDIYFQPETFSTGWSPGWNTMNFTVKAGSDIKFGIINGVEYCFYVGDDSKIHSIYFDRSVYGFKGGSVLNNDLPTVRDNSNIEFAVANNIARIFFIAGYDNVIHDCYYQPQNFSSGWSPGWTVGNLPQVRFGSKLEYRNIKNKQYLFFVSSDNKIHYLLCSNDTWVQNILRTDITDVASGSDLETGLVDDVDYLFFTAGYDNKIHDVRFDSNGFPISPGLLSAGDDPTLAPNSPISFLNINNDEYVIYISSCDGLFANWKQNDVIKKIDGYQLNSSYEFDIESKLNELDWDKHPVEGWQANPYEFSGYPKNYLCNSSGETLASDNSNHEIDIYNGYINLNIQYEQNGYWGRVTDYKRTPCFYGYK